MSGKIIGEGNEQYYKIDIKKPFTCEIRTVRKGKCDAFDEYKKIFDDKEDVKYNIYQILPILFSIDGTFFQKNQNKQTNNLTKSIYDFFTKLANYKKKKNLIYLFPRIRFEFKICPVDVIAKIIKKLSENKFIKDNYNSKFIDQLVYHNTNPETNQALKEKINVYVLDFEFLETNQKPKWKEIIPEKNVKRPFNEEKAKPVNGIIPTQPKDSPKIIFATQKKQTKSFSFYEKNGNLPNVIYKEKLENVIYKEKLDGIGFFGESDEVVEAGDADTNTNRASTKDDMEDDSDLVHKPKDINDIPSDDKMIEVGKREAEKAKKQEEVSDLDDKLSEFCLVKQNGKNEEQKFKIDLLRCLNKNGKGKIKIVFNKDNDTILPNYNLTNDYLRPNINGMKKQYTIELDGLSVNDLLEQEPALDYEGLLNKVDKMLNKDVKKELLANKIALSSTKEGRRGNLRNFLKEKIKNPETKPLIAKLLTEFKKLDDPFFCRKVLDRLKKMSVRKGFEKGFKKFDSDGDNALFEDEFKRFLHLMKAPQEDFVELWKRLSYDSDKITWKTLMVWINSGEWPKPVSVAVAKQKLIYAKPKKVDFQLPRGVEPGQMLTIKIKKEILYENNKYPIDLFVLLEPIPQSAKPGEKLSLRALKLAEPDANDNFDYIIKKEKDGDATSAFYIKYGNNDIFVKLTEGKSIEMYKNMKLNEVRVLSMRKVDGQKEDEAEREKEAATKVGEDSSLTTSDDAEIDKKTAINVGKIDSTDTGSDGTIRSKAAVGLVGTVGAVGAVAAPVAAVYGASLGISVIAEEGSAAAEVSEQVVNGMNNIYKGIKNFPDSSTIANVTEAGKDVLAFFSNPGASAASAGEGLVTFASNTGGFLLSNATNACTMVGLSAAAGPILLIALAGLAGLGVGFLIAKKAFVNGRNLYELMNAKSLRYDVSSFKIERINLKNIDGWDYQSGQEMSGDKEKVMKVLKKYVIPKMIQDVTDPTKPIENKYPIYINNVQYIEHEEQETRSFSALEEDMKNERAQGIMVTPDMEGMDPADIKKAKVKKNVFYVRFHTNYLTPFKLKGEEFALTSRGETYINKKLRTLGAFNKKKSNVYFYKGMVSLREVNPSRKPPRKIFENVVKKLFKDDLKTLIFDQFSLDEEAANVISERLKEIKDSTVLEMVVLNLLEVPSVIKILKCLADSKIKIKKLVIRRVRDTIGKMKKKKIDDLYKMEKNVKKQQKIQQNVYGKSSLTGRKNTKGNVLKGDNAKELIGRKFYNAAGGGEDEIYLQHGGTFFGIFN